MVAGPLKGRLVPTFRWRGLLELSLRLGLSRLPAKRRESSGSGTPHVRVLIFERDSKGRDGVGIADLAERIGGSPTHAPACVFEGGHKRPEGARIANLA